MLRSFYSLGMYFTSFHYNTMLNQYVMYFTIVASCFFCCSRVGLVVADITEVDEQGLLVTQITFN